MTFQKIKSGIVPFDNLFQGLYLNRPTLLSGRRRSGTSTLALRFLCHILQIGEKLLLFTEESPDHVSLEAHGLGTDVSEAIAAEQLSIVPYDRHLPLLPFPEALDELRTWLADRHYAFVVFDPVIPWLAAPPDRLEERLNAFFGLLDETGATSLLILRHPVSALARRLTDEISERCAICLEASQTPSGPRALEVTKYMGAPPEKCPTVLQLAAASPEPSPYQGDGMSLRELHKATQRINVTLPSYLTSTPTSPAPTFASAAGFRAPSTKFPAAPARQPGIPRPVDRPSDDISLFSIPPISLPHAPAPQTAPQQPPAPSRAPGRPPAPAATSAAAAPHTPSLAPMPSPFHSHESKSITQHITDSRIQEDPAVAASRPSTRHAIRFTDAEPAATRPHDAPAPGPGPAYPPRPTFAPRPPEAAPAAPTAPAAPAAPEHPIRFSDIIQ